MENLTYEEFIQNILDTRGRFACGDEYHERHHIVPKSIGGGNEKENLIDLYAREHFEAHRLLALENSNVKELVYAWWCMVTANGKYTDDIDKLTPEEYEEIRIIYSKSVTGENNPMFGKHHSEETRRKISENHVDVSGVNNPNYGKPCSEETKMKLSATRDKTPVIQLDMSGKFIAEYESATEAMRITGISSGNILGCCYDYCKSAGGFMWVLRENYDANKTYIYQNNSKRPVVQLDLCGNFISEYVSVSEASRITGIDNTCIYRACTNDCGTAGKFIWVFKEDYDPTKSYIHINKSYVAVVCLDVNDNYICEYESIAAAHNATGADCSSIIRCCKDKQKTAGGYKWMYKEDWDKLQLTMQNELEESDELQVI